MEKRTGLIIGLGSIGALGLLLLSGLTKGTGNAETIAPEPAPGNTGQADEGTRQSTDDASEQSNADSTTGDNGSENTTG